MPFTAVPCRVSRSQVLAAQGRHVSEMLSLIQTVGIISPTVIQSQSQRGKPICHLHMSCSHPAPIGTSGLNPDWEPIA